MEPSSSSDDDCKSGISTKVHIINTSPEYERVLELSSGACNEISKITMKMLKSSIGSHTMNETYVKMQYVRYDLSTKVTTPRDGIFKSLHGQVMNSINEQKTTVRIVLNTNITNVHDTNHFQVIGINAVTNNVKVWCGVHGSHHVQKLTLTSYKSADVVYHNQSKTFKEHSLKRYKRTQDTVDHKMTTEIVTLNQGELYQVATNQQAPLIKDEPRVDTYTHMNKQNYVCMKISDKVPTTTETSRITMSCIETQTEEWHTDDVNQESDMTATKRSMSQPTQRRQQARNRRRNKLNYHFLTKHRMRMERHTCAKSMLQRVLKGYGKHARYSRLRIKGIHKRLQRTISVKQLLAHHGKWYTEHQTHTNTFRRLKLCKRCIQRATYKTAVHFHASLLLDAYKDYGKPFLHVQRNKLLCQYGEEYTHLNMSDEELQALLEVLPQNLFVSSDIHGIKPEIMDMETPITSNTQTNNELEPATNMTEKIATFSNTYKNKYAQFLNDQLRQLTRIH